jgi:hypothetical protein
MPDCGISFHFNSKLVMDKNDEMQEHESKTKGAGRISNPGEQVKEEDVNPKDISQVDRQEGEMDHGELGGNFQEQVPVNKDEKS